MSVRHKNLQTLQELRAARLGLMWICDRQALGDDDMVRGLEVCESSMNVPHGRNDWIDTPRRRRGQSTCGRDGVVRQVRSLGIGDARDMPVKRRTQAHLMSMQRHQQGRQ